MEGYGGNPLFEKADAFSKEVYVITKKFPKHEMYGMTSQLRRAGLSVILNIIEGFARQTPKEFRRFLFISFGSLKESKYLIEFSKEQGYIDDSNFKRVYSLSEEVAKLLWTTIHKK
jgi:four helix bundle protein